MTNAPTVQLIQDSSNARSLAFNWIAGGAALTAMTGILMPVLLYRGYSLVTPIALGVLVNSAAWGGGYGLPRRVEGFDRRWNNRTTPHTRPLNPHDPQIAPYLARFPDAYEVVAIDRREITGAHLKKTWNWAHRPQAIRKISSSRVRTMRIAVFLGAALLLGSAAIGRLVQGLRPWQRWAALIPLAMASVGSGAELWMIKRKGERFVGRWHVRHALGRLIVAEGLSLQGLSEETRDLVRDREVSIWRFHAPPLWIKQCYQICAVMRPYGVFPMQDADGFIFFFRSPKRVEGS